MKMLQDNIGTKQW